jgi:hypothetical protein
MMAFETIKKNSLPPVNWRWIEEGDGYVGRLQPHGQPLGVGLPSGLQCLVPYPYRETIISICLLSWSWPWVHPACCLQCLLTFTHSHPEAPLCPAASLTPQHPPI